MTTFGGKKNNFRRKKITTFGEKKSQVSEQVDLDLEARVKQEKKSISFFWNRNR
jgi:hypothetical protein